jgi:hypothetical protein
MNMDFNTAHKQLREEQNSASLSHFLGLASQGRISQIIGELLPAKHIIAGKRPWNSTQILSLTLQGRQ